MIKLQLQLTIKPTTPMSRSTRAMLKFNLALDKAILKPVAYVYRENVADPLQTNVTNFLSNLRAPVIFGERPAAGRVRARRHDA